MELNDDCWLQSQEVVVRLISVWVFTQSSRDWLAVAIGEHGQNSGMRNGRGVAESKATQGPVSPAACAVTPNFHGIHVVMVTVSSPNFTCHQILL